MAKQENQNNFRALNSFSFSLPNLTPNSEIRTADVIIKYKWSLFEKEIITQMIVSLNRYPFASLSLAEKDWLRAEPMYTEFQTGYNEFHFDEIEKVLIFKCNSPSKLGESYQVEFRGI